MTVLRQETFCSKCYASLLIRTVPPDVVYRASTLLDMRSGCCNAYVMSAFVGMPDGLMFEQKTYGSLRNGSEPIVPSLSAAPPSPAPALRRKGKR